jgi:mRNA interferase MazF
VDFGLAAKVRPALVIGPFPEDHELALIVVIPHTTAIRGTKWEVHIPKSFLKPGAFHLQQVQPISLARFQTRLGTLAQAELRSVKDHLIKVLDL